MTEQKFSVVPRDVVRRTHPIRPRARQNPDNSWSFVAIKWVLRDDRFLVVITRESPSNHKWRVRVWLRGKDEPILDKKGLFTVIGGEWDAYDALRVAAGQPVDSPGSKYREAKQRQVSR